MLPKRVVEVPCGLGLVTATSGLCLNHRSGPLWVNPGEYRSSPRTTWVSGQRQAPPTFNGGAGFRVPAAAGPSSAPPARRAQTAAPRRTSWRWHRCSSNSELCEANSGVQCWAPPFGLKVRVSNPHGLQLASRTAQYHGTHARWDERKIAAKSTGTNHSHAHVSRPRCPRPASIPVVHRPLGW